MCSPPSTTFTALASNSLSGSRTRRTGGRIPPSSSRASAARSSCFVRNLRPTTLRLSCFRDIFPPHGQDYGLLLLRWIETMRYLSDQVPRRYWQFTRTLHIDQLPALDSSFGSHLAR